MKTLQQVLLFVAFATVVFSCKKDNENPGNDTHPDVMTGKWVGKFGFEEETPSTYYSFTLKSDGTLEERNSSNEKIGEGTWSLTGTSFVAKHHYYSTTGTTFTDVATYNAQAKKLENGTWGYSNNATDGGKWFMQKQ